jgi:hypothetical protein
MKRTNNKLISVKVEKNILLIMCILLFSLPVFGDYEISWSTIDGGGGTSTGGDYSLVGTIGQPDAADSQGDSFIVLGGFWSGSPVCIVNLEHFARFAEYWLMTGADLPADLYVDEYDIVNLDDLNVFLDYWLYYCPLDWPLRSPSQPCLLGNGKCCCVRNDNFLKGESYEKRKDNTVSNNSNSVSNQFTSKPC